ncbi:DUF5906 domain-containing protein [Halioglobus sp. HI00S01]|uniref:DUF5906 domain-containing protein n=1 Tax=Halioglobus sp. HI00S01 TaxID=1822214 RepID=UPI0012E811AE|nr:DUF5906 domain-containing protein [Halioglobus sp. HI00S01]
MKLRDPTSCIQELNRRYAVVTLGSKVVVVDERGDGPEFLGFQDFERLFANVRVTDGNRQVQLGKLWLSHEDRRQYLDGVVFDPAGNLSTSQYNLWFGFAVKPDKDESCDLILDHIRDVICSGNPEHYEYVLNWLALMVQQPGTLPLAAIVLLSEQGTGKGILMEYLGKLLGRHSKHITNKSHLLGTFSGHLQDAVLVFADELSWDGNKADAGILKGLITEPSRMMEKKFADAVTVKNCTHLIVASNEKWAVPTEISDRRYFVLEVSNARKYDHEYFEDLAAEMDAGGPSGLLWYLLQRDLKNFKASSFPSTPARLNQKIMSLDPIDRWLYEVLDVGHIDVDSGGPEHAWPLNAEKQAVYDSFCRWIVRCGLKVAAPNLSSFTSTLKGYGINTFRMSVSQYGVRPYGYRFPPLEAVRDSFQQTLGGKIWKEDVSNAA